MVCHSRIVVLHVYLLSYIYRHNRTTMSPYLTTLLLLTIHFPAFTAFSSTTTTTNNDGLRSFAQGLNLTIGAATPANLLNFQKQNNTSMYTQTLSNNYNLITAENECKWSSTEPDQNKFQYSSCDTIQKYADDNQMKFRGHNLCWGKYNPSWLTKLSPANKKLALENHIQQVVQYYGTKAFAWDVVNEAIADEIFDVEKSFQCNSKHGLIERIDNTVNPFGFKKSDWYPDVPDFVWVAFRTARKYAPAGTKLFYNDYSINSAYFQKSKRVYKLIANLTKEGLIDGVGLQMHINRGWENMYNNTGGLAQTFSQYKDLGLGVHVTEMDVKNGPNQGGENDLAQASTYGAVLNGCLNAKNCKNFETWGFEDGHSWISGNQHPLPFDSDFKAKAAATRIGTMLKNAPR